MKTKKSKVVCIITVPSTRVGMFERLIFSLTYMRSLAPKGHLFQPNIPKRVQNGVLGQILPRPSSIMLARC